MRLVVLVPETSQSSEVTRNRRAGAKCVPGFVTRRAKLIGTREEPGADGVLFFRRRKSHGDIAMEKFYRARSCPVSRLHTRDPAVENFEFGNRKTAVDRSSLYFFLFFSSTLVDGGKFSYATNLA